MADILSSANTEVYQFIVARRGMRRFFPFFKFYVAPEIQRQNPFKYSQ